MLDVMLFGVLFFGFLCLLLVVCTAQADKEKVYEISEDELVPENTGNSYTEVAGEDPDAFVKHYDDNGDLIREDMPLTLYGYPIETDPAEPSGIGCISLVPDDSTPKVRQ